MCFSFTKNAFCSQIPLSNQVSYGDDMAALEAMRGGCVVRQNGGHRLWWLVVDILLCHFLLQQPIVAIAGYPMQHTNMGGQQLMTLYPFGGETALLVQRVNYLQAPHPSSVADAMEVCCAL